MRYSTGAKTFIFILFVTTVFVAWLLVAPQSPAQRWSMSTDEFTCPWGDPVEVHSLHELDIKINKIAVSPHAARTVLCVTKPQEGEWVIYTGHGRALTMQQNY